MSYAAKLQMWSYYDEFASIWRQNDQECWGTSQNIQNNAKLQMKSNYNEFHRFDVKTITTTQNYESDQIIMHCINLTSKRSKKLSYVAKHSKQRKTTKVIKLQWIASIWCQKHQTNAKLQKWSYFDEFQSIWRQNYQNIWVRSQNYKSNQITMDCIDLMSKQSKMLSYVVKHSKLRKTTKEIKLQWIASIWCEIDQKRWGTSQNIQNNANLQNGSNYNELHRFDVKTIKNVEVRRKTFKTTQNYKTDQITMNCIDLTSKRSKLLS